MGGKSISCLRDTMRDASVANSSPHCLQYVGRCSTILSGFLLISNVLPSCPFCPPFFRNEASRKLLALLLPISCDGGVELVLLLRPFLSKSISSSKELIFCCSSTWYNGFCEKYKVSKNGTGRKWQPCLRSIL